MTIEIRVGPSRLTIHRSSTVLVTDQDGAVRADDELGLFHRDTRFLSRYEFIINGEQWNAVQSTPFGAAASRIYFTNPELRQLDAGPIPPHALGLQVDRLVSGGVHEDLTLSNYSATSKSLRLRLGIDADFADLFDVHAGRYVSRGVRDSFWDDAQRVLTINYCSGDFRRALVFRVGNHDPQPHFSNGQILFEIELPPGGLWRTCNYFTLVVDGERVEAPSGCVAGHLASAETDPSHDMWCESTRVESPHYLVTSPYRQAVRDIGALRIHEHDDAQDLWVPAAGVPWFLTLFGRDSLIVSLQSMMVSAPLALGALTKLAEFQAPADDPYRDAEPGKIMHELRYGELAHFHKVPHTPYYGTADATILYLIVLSELLRWTGERALFERFREPALRCLQWTDRYGDRDADGFQEYATRSPVGYYNQGWKDAGDAVMCPDGERVSLPIATCELQGYVYDAKLRLAEAFERVGGGPLPDRLRREAGELRRRFAEVFWLPQSRFIAYCLDGGKRPVATVASNPGHCLWSGILQPEQASSVARRLFESDMWSGWGIRTLSADHPAYDPFEYQRGAVWPHDNGIIAAGLYRYGYRDLANRVARGILDAASNFEHHRLPELFAGFPRSSDPFPVQYLRANLPQAWASGSIFHLLRAILGIEPDVPAGKIYLDPALPDWLDELTLRRLRIGSDRLALKFERSAGKSKFHVLAHDGKLELEAGPPPWFER